MPRPASYEHILHQKQQGGKGGEEGKEDGDKGREGPATSLDKLLLTDIGEELWKKDRIYNIYIGGRKPGCKGGMEVKPATHSDASSLAPFLLPFPSPPVQTTKTAILKRKILRTRVGAGLDGKGGGGQEGGR